MFFQNKVMFSLSISYNRTPHWIGYSTRKPNFSCSVVAFLTEHICISGTSVNLWESTFIMKTNSATTNFIHLNNTIVDRSYNYTIAVSAYNMSLHACCLEGAFPSTRSKLIEAVWQDLVCVPLDHCPPTPSWCIEVLNLEQHV